MDMDDAIALVVKTLENDKFKKKLIKKLNDSVDIPFINEKSEEKLIKAVYDAVLSAVKED